MDIKGKTALVTGGANGIGLCCVKELLRAGAKHIAVCDFDDVCGATVSRELNAEFGKGSVLFINVDVTKADDFEDAFKEATAAFKGLDIVLCLAGVFNEIEWEPTVAVNFCGMIRGSILAFQYMGKNKGGRGGVLCNVSSVAGLREFSSFPIHTAIQHGIIGLNRSFGHPFHFDRTGVRVVTLCPGYTETPLIVDPHVKLLDIEWSSQLDADLASIPLEKPEKVGVDMITALTEGNNGSVWISEGVNPAYEIEIPHYEVMKK